MFCGMEQHKDIKLIVIKIALIYFDLKSVKFYVFISLISAKTACIGSSYKTSVIKWEKELGVPFWEGLSVLEIHI